MILTGQAIRQAIHQGQIRIDPLDPQQIAQASVDVHLSPHLLVAPPAVALDVTKRSDSYFQPLQTLGQDPYVVLHPECFYLASTLERICAPHHVVVVDGKSSLARLGVQIHLTAGYVEPGFNGPITLEITVLRSIKIPVGWPMAQLRFHTLEGDVESYQQRGHYHDARFHEGPQLSRSYQHHPRHVGKTT